MSAEDEGPVIGIDLGTTYSCVGVVRNDLVEIIPSESNSHITASCVFFNGRGERLVGDAAKEQSFRNPLNTIYGVKRFIGRTYREYKKQENKTFFPYIVKNQEQRPLICVTTQGQEQSFAPEEISAMVLAKLKERAEEYLKTRITRAVITVPAHFNDAQRQATKNAGTIAGLEVLRIINEPTAAALAYELNNKHKNSMCNVLIYDFGGGTFDVSIVTIEDEIIEVLATNGEVYLGGDDIDKRLTEFLIKEFKEKNGVDMSVDQRAVRRLQQQCEKAKRNLSSQTEINIDIDLLYDNKDMCTNMNREQFEKMNEDLFKKTLICVEKTLKDAKLAKKEIQEIVLVGGTSRIPYVRKMVQEFFDNKVLNASLNPDEAVAVGAARQGAILRGNCSDKIVALLHDVCSLSLGIEAKGGIMSFIIPRSTSIPAEQSKAYRTSKDNQTYIDIPVYEGERPMVKGNRLLGKFKLEGLAPLPKGECNLEVTFKVDCNGILNVTAEDCQSRSKSYFTSQSAKGKLTDEEIQQMISNAAKYKQEDEERKRCIQAKNDLENYCFNVLKVLTQIEIGETERIVVENNCETVQIWMKDNADLTATDYYKKKDELYKVCSALINSHI